MGKCDGHYKTKKISITVGKESVNKIGSSALPVLSGREKVARVSLVSQCIPPRGVRDNFLGKTLFNAVVHWFLGGSASLLSTGSAEEPDYCTVSVEEIMNISLTQLLGLIVPNLGNAG